MRWILCVFGSCLFGAHVLSGLGNAAQIGSPSGKWNVSHIHLGVRDLETAAAWFEKVMELKLARPYPGAVLAWYDRRVSGDKGPGLPRHAGLSHRKLRRRA